MGTKLQCWDVRFFRIDDAQIFDDPEFAPTRLANIHVHPRVMLARHHFGRTTWTLRDPGVIERFDDGGLIEGARFSHGCFPKLHPAIKPRAGAPGSEQRAAGKERLGVTRGRPLRVRHAQQYRA